MFSRAKMHEAVDLIDKRLERLQNEIDYWKDTRSKMDMTKYTPVLEYFAGPSRNNFVATKEFIEISARRRKPEMLIIPKKEKKTDFSRDFETEKEVGYIRTLVEAEQAKTKQKEFDFNDVEKMAENLQNRCSMSELKINEKTAFTVLQKMERAGKIDQDELYQSMQVQLCTNFLFANSETSIRELISESTRIVAIRKKQLLELFDSSQNMDYCLQRRAWIKYEKNLTLQKMIYILYGLKQGCTFEDLERTQSELSIENLK